jgi:hypothetical protein
LSWPKGPFDTLDDTIEKVAAFNRIHHGEADDAASAAFEAYGVTNFRVT